MAVHRAETNGRKQISEGRGERARSADCPSTEPGDCRAKPSRALRPRSSTMRFARVWTRAHWRCFVETPQLVVLIAPKGKSGKDGGSLPSHQSSRDPEWWRHHGGGKHALERGI